ncbi:DUF2442 domain-containing protein [bacterium]|nr:DUF2442 domain-containing protein [bacterium]
MSTTVKAPTITDIWRMERKLIAVEGLAGFILRATYADGETYDIDFSGIVGTGGLTNALSDPDFFSQVKVGPFGDSAEWPNGYDNGSDTLRWDGELARRGLTRADVPVDE